jgi:hypothetical protein
VELSSLLKFRRMSKSDELCLKNFPQKSEENVDKDFAEYSQNVIDSKQKVLKIEHVSFAVKIQVTNFFVQNCHHLS